MRTTVFLSYSSAQSDAATRIELALKGEGYSVFRDRAMLPPGESFDARIRAAIEESDLFIFLISRESVSEGRYTLTELRCAEQKWGHPAGRVLPVFAEATPKEAIPAFLRAVTILQPRGDIAAEVAAEVGRLSASWWRRMLEPRRDYLEKLVKTTVPVLTRGASGAKGERLANLRAHLGWADYVRERTYRPPPPRQRRRAIAPRD